MYARRHFEETPRYRKGCDNASRESSADCGRVSGLIDAIDQNLHLLKRHLPYHESDHVLNVAYNILCHGDCLVITQFTCTAKVQGVRTEKEHWLVLTRS